MEMNYLLFAVLGLYILLMIRGYRKGFLQIIVYFAGIICILIAARRISPYVSDYLMENTETYSVIQENITEKFKEKNLERDNTILDNQIKTINSYEIPDILKNSLITNNTKEMYTTLLVSVFEEYVSAYLAKTAVKAISFVGLFLVLWISFRIILALVNLVSRIPIIKGLNKIAGAFLGFFEATIITWVFFFIAIIFIGDSIGLTLLGMISKSPFLTTLFNTNILMTIIS